MTVATAGLAIQQRRRAKGVPGASVQELIAGGEGERVELKSTARWNTRSGAKDARIEDEVVVTIAGFMNASGGTLLLGVEDDGTVRGLAEDYPVARVSAPPLALIGPSGAAAFGTRRTIGGDGDFRSPPRPRPVALRSLPSLR